MYSISDIALHRERKLKTLLSNELESVKAEFSKKLESFEEHLDIEKVKKVFEFTCSQDYGQGPLVKYYVTHPIRVASFVMDWMRLHEKYSTDFLVAALIHNVIEKGILTQIEIQTIYGQWMSHTITVLTQDREALKDPKKKELYYESIYKLDEYGQLLKFFDKFDNLYAICLNPDPVIRAQYIEEIEIKITPIVTQFAPEFKSYIQMLIQEMKQFGHYHPKYG